MCMPSLRTIYETFCSRGPLTHHGFNHHPKPGRFPFFYFIACIATSMVTKNKFFTFLARLTPPPLALGLILEGLYISKPAHRSFNAKIVVRQAFGIIPRHLFTVQYSKHTFSLTSKKAYQLTFGKTCLYNLKWKFPKHDYTSTIPDGLRAFDRVLHPPPPLSSHPHTTKSIDFMLTT